MKNTVFLCALCALILSAPVWGVNYPDDLEWESILEEILPDEELSLSALEELMEFYEQLHESPLNINTASREELESLRILSAPQIEAIHAYIYINGPMKTLGELQLTGALDWNTRRILRYLVYAGEPSPKEKSVSLKNMFRYSRNELTYRMDIPLYLRDGFRKHSEEELARYPNRSYLGGKLSHSVRYSFNWGGHVRAGFTADKDAGEPFGGKNRTGYDFWSPYLYLSDMGPFRTLVAGNYKALFGQGLLSGGGFSLGKSMSINGVSVGQSGLKPHSSTSEYGFFRGAGTALQLGRHVSFTLMAAFTPADAIIKGDTVISSFKTDGYHRTSLEWSRKHNVRITSGAMNISYRYNGISIGTTILKERYSVPVAKGHGYTGLSADWSINRPVFGLSGEVACSGGGLGLLSNNIFRMGRNLTSNVLFRYYSPSFYAPRSGAICESDVKNETGLLIGLNLSRGRIKSGAYLDLFHYPESRYGATGASNGMEVRVSTEWKVSVSDRFDFLLRFKAKQQDCKPTETLEYCMTWRGRLRWDHSFGKCLTGRAQFLWSRYDFLYEPLSDGFGVSLSADWNPSKVLGVSLQTVYFLTDSYESKISVYEKGPRYSFGFITLSGRGGKLALNLKYKPSDHLQLNLKVSSLLYADRDEISSSQQRISSPHKEDVNMQFTWIF